MSDSDSTPDQPAIPSWQKAQSDQSANASESTEPAPTPTTTRSSTTDADTPAAEAQAEEVAEAVPVPQGEHGIEVARRFLDNDAVRHAPHDKKVAFLQSKGIDDADIQTLLASDESSDVSEADASTDTSDSHSSFVPTPTETLPPSPPSQPPVDRPPIVTYPEFLAKPPRPPPLVTKERLFNALYAVTGLSTLVYGTSRYVVRPMVDGQAEARTEFHDLTSRKIDALVSKLEKTVSEVPPKKPSPVAANVEDDSEAEDPTEMFHRDMGTQTTFPISSVTAMAGKDGGNESPAKHHTNQLASLNKTLSGLKDEYRSQSEGMDNIKTAIDVLRDDLDNLTFTGQADHLGGYDIYGRPRKAEPDDEIRKVRDNIRRVKGVLLSTRNFPATAR
ncbi:hypothetical protein NM208_g6613 [Fusarium decemcellulare]|uniref:Uncharacterized protein n=1 Tax=Fusarium decemcellulare TaxID=57161 RepID=A0ACC1SCM9_9HYPO|nr:hypothetical protein NM208_g6613 [Fusarium decemcellulare]